MMKERARLLCLVVILALLALVGLPEVLPIVEHSQVYQTAVRRAANPSAPCATLVVPAPASARLETGDLSAVIAQLENNMPAAGSDEFAIPTNAEMAALQAYIASILAGAAPSSDGTPGFETMLYADQGDGRAYSLLVHESSSRTRGWGVYALRLGRAADVVLEAPHPVADRDTSAVALLAYRALHARALLIAGAHRDADRDGSADVAHNPQTAFQAVHQSLVDACPVVVLQIHGFASGIREGYPDVVLSSGQVSGSDVLGRLAEGLRAEGLTVGVCNGTDWLDLCGQTNVQAEAMGKSTFVHLELSESLRADPDRFIGALERVLGS